MTTPRTPGESLGDSLKTLEPGASVTLVKIAPCGSLVARKQKGTSVVAFYWRYTFGPKGDTQTERVLIGVYGPGVAPKSVEPVQDRYSITAAIRAAEKLAIEHHAHRNEGGRPALLAAKEKLDLEVAAAKAASADFTVEKLLKDYCDYLQAQAKESHSDARSIFKKHVFEPWPEQASKLASELTSDDVSDMMRRCIEGGLERTSNKLRSYLHAAYGLAVKAKSKPKIPQRFKDYKITTNPVAGTVADETANRSAKNPLRPEELREYWRAIKDLEGFRGALLRIHLLSGAQRIKQLLELKTEKINWTERQFVLMDKKGRNAVPRAHMVPMLPTVERDLRSLPPRGEWAISTDRGKTHVAHHTLYDWAIEVASSVVDDEGKPKIKGFTPKRLRSGVETILASVDVHENIRGRLQSHGVSGVQAKHYDAWDYLPQKRKALETLYRLLQEAPRSNVTPLRRARQA